MFLNKISGDLLDISFSELQELKGEVSLKNLKADLSGASYLNLVGSVTDLNIESSGASRTYLYSLIAENTALDLSGASVAEVNTTNTLSVSASEKQSILQRQSCNK